MSYKGLIKINGHYINACFMMKFYNRTTELEILRSNYLQSLKTPTFQAIIGRRRIGKTMLITESLQGQKYVYFFVSRKSEPILCAEFQHDVERMIGLKIFGTINRFKDLFEQLLLFATKENFTLVIDEFQEFDQVNSAIFSDIQNLWDQYKDRIKINFIVCGSVYSLMMKIFENNKEPLFGRLTSKIYLQPFKVDVIKEILTDYHPHYKPDDLLCLYMITGGVAKYIEILMEAGAFTKKLMLDLVTQKDSVFLNEGRNLLMTEFGKEYGTYFTILQLIASGKTS